MSRDTPVPDRESIVTYHSPALEDNPIGASPRRRFRIYLPPGYSSGDQRYPVIYLLHGYGGDPSHPIVESRRVLYSSFPAVVRLLLRRVLKRVMTFETLDSLILTGALPPFILVQPDGSLPLPHLSGGSHPNGDPKHKGGMYFDSTGTGRFGRSVFLDAVDFVDATYRTIPDRSHRAVAGGSMGGYGALLAGIFHPERFCAVAALSPSICGLDILDIELTVPFERWIHGKAGAAKAGRDDLADILDTCDLVFSPDRPLIPTISRDSNGRCVQMDDLARSNWAAADAGNLVGARETAFSDVAVRVSCEERDEFHLLEPDRRFVGVLEAAGITHEAHFFRDNGAARVSAHAAGIGLQVVAGLQFCLDRMKANHMIVSET